MELLITYAFLLIYDFYVALIILCGCFTGTSVLKITQLSVVTLYLLNTVKNHCICGRCATDYGVTLCCHPEERGIPNLSATTFAYLTVSILGCV